MELVALRCNNCGASLEVSETARFVTCGICNKQLKVTRADNTTFTEVLDQRAEQSGQLAGNLKVMALQNHLERLDREWQREREASNATEKPGPESRTRHSSTVVSTLASAVLVTGWIVGALQMDAPVVFPCLFTAVLIAIGYQCISAIQKAEDFEKAEARFQAERKALLEKIVAAQEPPQK